LLPALLVPAVVSAHAELISVAPLDGERLAEAPTAVTLTFNEPIGLAPDGVRVLDANGDPVDDEPEVVDGPAVLQPLPTLPDGWYVVTWGIVSEDGHIIRSASVFGVGEVALEARPDAAVVGSAQLSAVLRALTDGAVVIAAGAWAAWWFYGARVRAVRRLAVAATAVALAATVGWMLVGWHDGGGTWLGSPAGLAGAVRGVLLGVALVATGRAPRVVAIAASGALLTLLGGGHAAGSPIDLALQASHLLAASVWLGAAPAVLLVLRDGGLPDDEALDVVRRFSRAAAFALVVVATAGATLAWRLSDGLAAGLSDPWALTLGAKLVVVVVAVTLGAWGRRRLTREPRRDRFTRLFAVDATLLLAVATLSSMLTLDSPDPDHAAHGTAASDRCATALGETPVSVIVSPGRTGDNLVRVDGLESGMQGLSLGFRHQRTAGASLTTEATEAAEAWQASAVLPLEGPWEVTVTVRVDAFSEERGTCTIGMAP
jgi:copper transport protein